MSTPNPFEDLVPASGGQPAANHFADLIPANSPAAPTVLAAPAAVPTATPIGTMTAPALAAGPPVNPFDDLVPDGRPSATALDDGFWANLTPRDIFRAMREESAVASLGKYLTGHTDAVMARRRQALGMDRDPVEAELGALAEAAYQQGGYESPAFIKVEEVRNAYRAARDNPEFHWEDLMAAAKANPGPFFAEFVKAALADPELLITPLGWSKAAAAAGATAKALGSGGATVRAARAGGGLVGAGGTGAAVMAPVSVAQQLVEGGGIEPDRVGRESAIAGGASMLTAGLFVGTAAGLRRLRALKNRPGVDTTAVDAEVEKTLAEAEAVARDAGMDPAEVRNQLTRIVETPEGAVVAPRADVLDGLPAPAAKAEPPAEPAKPDTRRERLTEYERLADLTEDADVRTTLRRQAEILRTELAGEAPKLTPRERSERARRVDPAQDDLVTAIRKLGGIDTETETDWAGRLSHLPRRGFGLPAIERPGRGRTLDDLAEVLAEHGYLERRDVDELYNKLDRAAGGEALYSFRSDVNRVAGQPEPPLSTDRDWSWTTPEEARDSGRDHILTDNGAAVLARDMTLDDWLNLEKEMQNAERWFEREAGHEPSGDTRGAGGARVPERLGDPVPGRAPEPQPGETAGLPGIEPRNETRQQLAGRAAEVAARLRGEGEPVAPGEGPGDLFSGRARQADLEDLAGFKLRSMTTGKGGKIEEPLPTTKTAAPDAAGRGAAAVSQQLDLFLPTRAPEAEHLAALKTFGPRVKHVQTGSFPSALTRATRPEDIAHVVAPLRKEAQESLLAVMTDADGNILRIARLHTGSRASAHSDPGLIAGAAANTPGARMAWFVHNHPSGVATQSHADRVFTGRLHEVLGGSGVEPQGMIVVAPGGRYTYYHPGPGRSGATGPGHEEFKVESRDLTGGVEFEIPASQRARSFPVTERRLVQLGNKLPPITGAPEMAVALRSHGEEGVLLLDQRHQPVGFLPMTGEEMRRLRAPQDAPGRRLLAAIDETNASAIAARAHGSQDDVLAAGGNLDGFAKMTDVRLLDVMDENLQSFAERIPSQSTFYANPFVYALRDAARDIGLRPGRNLAAGVAGGVVGATTSEGEPGSAQWWLDVSAGAAVGITLGQFMRRTNLLGKGSIVDNARIRLGEWIESLPLIGRGPEELRDLKAKQRLMKEMLDRQTAEVGQELLKRFTPAERAMMADLIETRGIVKDMNVIHRQAAILDDYLAHVARRMKELGMLPKDLEEGGYLHRYYAKHLGLDRLFREAKGQTLSGSYAIARGTDDVFSREFFSHGATEIVDEIARVTRQIARLERRRADLLDADTTSRLEALQARKRALQKQELLEYVGHQNGKIKSFLFTREEVARIETGISPVLARMHKPKPGELDARALPQAPGVADLKPTDRVWSVRGTKPKEVLLHRDWTKAERKSWGEIEDAGYRYVRGMVEASHDLSLATLFKTVANNKEWVSGTRKATKGKEWVFVPDTKVGKYTPLKKYGALAGQYVRPDIWAGIQGYGRNPLRGGPRIPGTEYRVGDVYLGLLNRWKLYKTVYNPVTHFNNSYSNTEMLHMGGYGPADIARAVQHMREGERSAVWREARDAGLFGGDWTTSLLRPETGGEQLTDLAEKLRTQPQIPDAELTTSLVMDLKEWWIKSKQSLEAADGAWQSGAAIAKAMAQPVLAGVKFSTKPVAAVGRAARRAYKFEDDLFKLAVFAAERRNGTAPPAAVSAAQNLFFDYQDVPLAVKLARDLPVGSPFITYTYKAIPAMARNIAQHPERVLLLIAGYEALNYAALTADGMSPGEYWQIESAEEQTSAPWDRGRALWGARNTVRMPFMEGYRLALGRAHALGNPFMDDAGGRQKLPEAPGAARAWGSSVFGSNPLHALLDAAVNEDWKGKEIYRPGAPDAEKAQKIAAYLYQAWAPSNLAIPGSYPQARVLEGLANEARQARAEGRDPGVIAPVVDAANRTSEALGFGQFTGIDRGDNEIRTRDALLASFGIKLRPIRVEQTVDIEASKLEGEKRKAAEWFQEKARLNAEGRITDAQLDTYEEQFDEILDRIDAEEETFFEAEAFLKKREKAHATR